MYRRRYESRRLSKPKLHFKKNKKNKIWRKTIFNIMADKNLTSCNVARYWHWFRQVTATLQCDMWLWHHDSKFTKCQHPAMWYVRGSEMTCHWIRPNVRHIGILHLVSISTISPQSTSHSAPVCKILSKSDHPWQKKMTSCRFSRWRTWDLSHLGF